jgi:hypothetical protein
MVGRRIGDEFVLVPLAGRGADIEDILNLNKVGAFIWEQIDGTRDGTAVVEALLNRFDVEQEEAESDYLAFVTQLRSVKALQPAEGSEG